jgi:DNA-binding GntR family transcriptional regulator
LRAQELAQALSLSRTPIREALGRLAQEGLVERLGGWGFTVRALTVQDVLDLFNVREALEVEAARAALEKIGDAEVARFDALLGQSRRALEKGKLVESIRLARRFHVAIAQASGNRLLLQMLERINDRIHIVGLSLVSSMPERAARVYEENVSILESLRSRDAQALERAVRTHIHRSKELFLRNSGRYRLQ